MAQIHVVYPVAQNPACGFYHSANIRISLMISSGKFDHIFTRFCSECSPILWDLSPSPPGLHKQDEWTMAIDYFSWNTCTAYDSG